MCDPQEVGKSVPSPFEPTEILLLRVCEVEFVFVICVFVCGFESIHHTNAAAVEGPEGGKGREGRGQEDNRVEWPVGQKEEGK